MKVNSDYRDLLKGLNAAGVRFLIVGGYAVMAYTEPRYTKDLDLWIEASESNARTLFTVLAGFGAPLKGVQWSDFTEPQVFYQLGVETVRFDIMTSIPGLRFAEAWDRRTIFDFDGEPAPVISNQDLQTAKAAAGRPRDRKDLKRLVRRKS